MSELFGTKESMSTNQYPINQNPIESRNFDQFTQIYNCPRCGVIQQIAICSSVMTNLTGLERYCATCSLFEAQNRASFNVMRGS